MATKIGAMLESGRITHIFLDRELQPSLFEATGWLGYRLNDFFALTSGVRAMGWGSIGGVPVPQNLVLFQS